MRIAALSNVEHVAWEGELEPLGEEVMFKGIGGDETARVTLGQPEQWAPELALESQTGKKWAPPAGDRKYTLLRLACTLHPPADQHTRYTRATLQVYLSPQQGIGLPIAHDLYPLKLSVEDKGKRTITLGPELKFGTVDIKLLEVGAELEFVKSFATIEGFGLGESQPYWRFAHHAARPLLGSQAVYLVLAAPTDAGGVRLSAGLDATLETRWGPLRVGTPQSARDALVWTVGV